MVERQWEDEAYREEIINGVTLMAPAPSESHNNIMANILVIFRNYLKGKHCRAYGDNGVHRTPVRKLTPRGEGFFVNEYTCHCSTAKSRRDNFFCHVGLNIFSSAKFC